MYLALFGWPPWLLPVTNSLTEGALIFISAAHPGCFSVICVRSTPSCEGATRQCVLGLVEWDNRNPWFLQLALVVCIWSQCWWFSQLANFRHSEGGIPAAHICTRTIILASIYFSTLYYSMSEQTPEPQHGPHIESIQQHKLPPTQPYQSPPPAVSFKVFKPTDTVTKLLGESLWNLTHCLANSTALCSTVARWILWTYRSRPQRCPDHTDCPLACFERSPTAAKNDERSHWKGKAGSVALGMSLLTQNIPILIRHLDEDSCQICRSHSAGTSVSFRGQY